MEPTRVLTLNSHQGRKIPQIQISTAGIENRKIFVFLYSMISIKSLHFAPEFTPGDYLGS